MKFKGTIVVTDPCYLTKKITWEEREKGAIDDWGVCDCGEHMERLGFKHFWVERTGIGDGAWPMDNLGEFSADSGLTGCFLLDEILAYNKDFINEDLTGSAVIIEDFDGEVNTSRDTDGNLIVKVSGAAKNGRVVEAEVNLGAWYGDDEDE